MARNTLPRRGKTDKQTSSGQNTVLMAGIDWQDDPEKVREFVKRCRIQSPAVYVLGGENRVVGANAGEAPKEVYEGWIEEAL